MRRHQEACSANACQQIGPARAREVVHLHDASRKTGIPADGERHERDAKDRERDGEGFESKREVHKAAWEA